jgi:hypothetical protein
MYITLLEMIAAGVAAAVNKEAPIISCYPGIYEGVQPAFTDLQHTCKSIAAELMQLVHGSASNISCDSAYVC